MYTVRAQVTAKLKQLTDLFEAGKLMLAEDFLIDVHTGTWFANIAMSGIVGILIAGPIGFAVGAGTPTIIAMYYERKIWKTLKDLVTKNSKKQLDLNKVESY